MENTKRIFYASWIQRPLSVWLCISQCVCVRVAHVTQKSHILWGQIGPIECVFVALSRTSSWCGRVEVTLWDGEKARRQPNDRIIVTNEPSNKNEHKKGKRNAGYPVFCHAASFLSVLHFFSHTSGGSITMDTTQRIKSFSLCWIRVVIVSL